MRSTFTTIIAGALLAVAASLPAQASVDVNGYKFEDTAKVAGKDLKLNGAGMRTKLVFKVYAAGLYLTEKKTSVAEVLKQEGPRQIGKMGELFASVDAIKKGDVLHLDWIPGTGTQAELNGKKLGEPIPDINFYNAILRIWLGDKPVDKSLKPALLGEAK
jgi:hypothetical protein